MVSLNLRQVSLTSRTLPFRFKTFGQPTAWSTCHICGRTGPTSASSATKQAIGTAPTCTLLRSEYVNMVLLCLEGWLLYTIVVIFSGAQETPYLLPSCSMIALALHTSSIVLITTHLSTPTINRRSLNSSTVH